MSRRAAIAAAAMVAAALLFFASPAGFSGGTTSASGESAQRITALREEIQAARAKSDALPRRAEAERALLAAGASAVQVAHLQNDYRQLATAAAAAGGTLDVRTASPTRRNLVPYFAPTISPSALAPWYLLANDKDLPDGDGSGFAWVAQRPCTITDDAATRVTWLAVATRAPAGAAAPVLAWARADFDLTRQTFSNLETGTTVSGEALRLQVKPS